MIEQPYSLDAEQAVLGSVIMDPNSLTRLNLTQDKFYNHAHRMIWDAFLELNSQHKPIDYLSLVMELERTKKLNEIGGRAYITKLCEDCVSLNGEHYASIVREKAKRRAVIQNAQILAQAAFAPESDLDSVIAQTVNDLVMNASAASGAVHIKEFASVLYDEVETRYQNPAEVYGIPSGLAGFDKITCGLQKKEIFILSGEPGVGKSLLAAQIGFHMAKNNRPGVYYAMEMSGVAVLRREISNRASIKTYNMRSGKLSDSDWENFTTAIGEISDHKFYMSDRTAWTTTSLHADLSRMKQTHQIEWFILDYMDLLNDENGASYNEKSAFVSRQLHNIAKDLDLAGLIIQSMNKVGMGTSTPGKEHLSGSGKVTYDADQIAIMTRDAKDKNIINLVWEKQREGEMKGMRLTRKPGFPAFYEVLLP